MLTSGHGVLQEVDHFFGTIGADRSDSITLPEFLSFFAPQATAQHALLPHPDALLLSRSPSIPVPAWHPEARNHAPPRKTPPPAPPPSSPSKAAFLASTSGQLEEDQQERKREVEADGGAAAVAAAALATKPPPPPTSQPEGSAAAKPADDDDMPGLRQTLLAYYAQRSPENISEVDGVMQRVADCARQGWSSSGVTHGGTHARRALAYGEGCHTRAEVTN
jgi:hypothetical protein